MYTLDMNKISKNNLNKTALVYLAGSVAAIAVDNVYALFGHGVRSAAMSRMFLYPLLGGTLGFLTLGFIAPCVSLGKWYRLGYNLYNSGLAALTVGSFFKGILDIAGTASEYTRVFSISGVLMAAAGMFILIGSAIHMRRVSL